MNPTKILSSNSNSWHQYSISDYFDVLLAKGDIKEDDMEDGNIPLVSAGRSNNGIVRFIDKSGDGISEIFPANYITLDMFGNAFYQNKAFYAVSHGRVNILKPKFTLTKNIALFIVTIINQESYRFSYGRALYSSDVVNMIIKLPSNADDGAPDWEYMENYIKSLYHKPLTTKNRGLLVPNLNLQSWKEYRFGNLISKIYKAKAINKDDLTPAPDAENAIRYITRTGEDNGCELLADIREVDPRTIEKPNAISIGDTTATCFYQNDNFITGDHMVIVRADSWLNKYTAMFILAILNNEQYRYSYGRAFLMDGIRDTMIRLPADRHGNPDWQFMENYIKSLPYGDRI